MFKYFRWNIFFGIINICFDFIMNETNIQNYSFVKLFKNRQILVRMTEKYSETSLRQPPFKEASPPTPL